MSILDHHWALVRFADRAPLLYVSRGETGKQLVIQAAHWGYEKATAPPVAIELEPPDWSEVVEHVLMHGMFTPGSGLRPPLRMHTAFGVVDVAPFEPAAVIST